MILFLVALVGVIVLAVWTRNQGWSFISDFVSPLFVVIGLLGLIAYSFLGFGYVAAEHKANIINREFHKNYSQVEVFYASDVIVAILELDGKRIELKGNMVTDK